MSLPFLPLPLHPTWIAEPKPRETVTLFFASGAIRTGFWNGQDWICNGERVSPDYWQALRLPDDAEPVLAPVYA
jgi:hypothetical protein